MGADQPKPARLTTMTVPPVKAISSALTKLGVMTASPIAFLVVLVYAGLWAIFDHDSLDSHGIATLATWLMTLVIQRSEHRDTQAIHAKLDELLHVHGNAEDDLAQIDEKEPEDIEKKRDQERAN